MPRAINSVDPLTAGPLAGCFAAAPAGSAGLAPRKSNLVIDNLAQAASARHLPAAALASSGTCQQWHGAAYVWCGDTIVLATHIQQH